MHSSRKNLIYRNYQTQIRLTLSGKLSKEVRLGLPVLVDLKRRMMSWSVAATTKYSCFRRSSFPSKNCSRQNVCTPCNCPGLPFCACLMQKRGPPHVVVGVENAGDVFRQVSVQDGLDVVPLINYRRAGRVFTSDYTLHDSKLKRFNKRSI